MASTTTVLDPSTSDDQTSITCAGHDPLYPHVLNRYTVMHYFEFSPFFDRNSNNMLARRQNLDPAVPGVLDSLPPGIEYVVEVEQAPHLFVIRKQQRREDKKDAAAAAAMAAGGPGAGAGGPLTLAHYYVLDKMVYQAPTLHAALATRLRRCVWSLQEGFTRLKRDLDPLQKLLRDEQKRKRQLEQQQQQQQQEHKADAGGAATAASDPAVEAAAEAAAAVQAVAASAAHAGGDRVEEEAGPVAKGYSAEEERRWRKASNIIDSVLSQFPLPKMPPEYYNTPQQQQQQQQLQQQQEDAKKPQADEGPSPTGAAAATTAPATGAAAVPPRAPTPVGGGAATPQAVAPAAAVAPAPASKRSRQR